MALFRMKPHYRKRGGTLSYYGVIANLEHPSQYLAATSVGNYALFGSGLRSVSSQYTNGDLNIYNTSLVKLQTGSIHSCLSLAATSVGNYALFGGGRTAGSEKNASYYNKVSTCNTSLTTSTAPTLGNKRSNLAATSVGNYALFGGGFCYYTYGNGARAEVDAYDTSLTHSNPADLGSGKRDLAATSVGNYALFGGGRNDDHSNEVFAYDTSLTRVNAPSLKQNSCELAATSVGNYALFGGGRNGYGYNSYVTAYDTSLTKITNVDNLNANSSHIAATSVKNYALFGGGYNNVVYAYVATVTGYDSALTKINANDLSIGRSALAATSVGNYALFGGGDVSYDSIGTRATVDVYQVT